MARLTWLGTTSAYATASNWTPIGIVNSTYRWTLSGSGTSNYYLELAGGGNPSLSQPSAVQENGSALTGGTAGALTASQWGWGNVDALGFSTIYVRLAGSSDPDSQAIDYVTYTRIPVSNDDVRFPAGAGDVAGTDQSAVALASFIVEEGFSEAIASSTTWLRITTSRFEFNGSGSSAAYIDLAASAVSPQVFGTPSGGTGVSGLNLIGSAISTVNCVDGSVGIAQRHQESATVSTVRVIGSQAIVTIGAGVSLTSLYVVQGSAYLRCAATTVTTWGGEVRTQETGAITTLNAYGGVVYPNSTGTITTLTVDGAIVEFTTSAVARTVTNLKHNSGTLHYDPAYVTVTTRQAPDNPALLVGSAP